MTAEETLPHPLSFAPLLQFKAIDRSWFHLPHLVYVIATNPKAPLIRRMPKGASSVRIRIALLTPDKKKEPANEEYTTLEPFKTTNIKLFFKKEDVGKKLFIKASYIDKQGNEGPESKPVFCSVPDIYQPDKLLTPTATKIAKRMVKLDVLENNDGLRNQEEEQLFSEEKNSLQRLLDSLNETERKKVQVLYKEELARLKEKLKKKKKHFAQTTSVTQWSHFKL